VEEDALIGAIAALRSGSGRVLLGIGDDAAAWQPSRSHRSVVTTDALIEGVHFTLDGMTLGEIGWRAMAANLSDLAAMGARARLGTVALGVPAQVDAAGILALSAGMAECARRYGLEIAGGDLTRAPVVTIVITAIGEVRPTHLKTRAGAREGDVLAVTGMLGASRAGLDVLRAAVTLDDALRAQALAAHRTPLPRLAEGAWLAARAHVHAMMDCSDGLSTDLRRLTSSSGVGAVVDRVPVAQAALAAARQLKLDPAEYALAGGEDYELLVAVAPRAFGHVARGFAARFGRALEPVGRVRADERLMMVKQAGEEPIARTGWDHFT
jgi:thiamine-monophosphate kinase